MADQCELERDDGLPAGERTGDVRSHDQPVAQPVW
jgi:hypothetical protein